ncbi:glutathione S-transferase family protein [Pusillimonas caeni]|uniref:glutathione S-transferase family protein n=1 Tax=Pusillimonas caeni TaxID=1348472 RepID=UPI000E59F935|nr:glutathione S-transferase N-terminal domain-containing protein [Pusillimonas caeni]TFL14796.1 glutathione S-transferase family protein [Pusillimonas caeni]
MEELTLLTYPGPNDLKVRIMLAEVAAQYVVKQIDIKKGEQFHPGFLALSPNNKIPVLLDTSEGSVTIFETGAILTYLAEKYGCLLPGDQPRRAQTFAWLHFGTGGLGSTLPQLHHYLDTPQSPRVAVDRFAQEAIRLFSVLEHHLASNEYLAGEYTIADIPSYVSTSGWLRRVKALSDGKLQETPHINRWLGLIAGRVAVSSAANAARGSGE